MKKTFFSAITCVNVVALTASPCQAQQSAAKQSQTDNSVTFEEVIVIGEKTARSIKETASSVMVMTPQNLDSMSGVISSNSLLDQIPNIVTVEPGNEAPAVRGVDGTGPASGANAFLAGTRPRLNYQLDGRTLGFNEALFQNSSLWDVQQVELYRGPQSTLQGRNSIAGAIVIHTADPSFEWDGKLRAIAGEQDKQVGSFAIGGPLLENVLAFRLAGDYQQSETAVEFTPYAEENEPDVYQTETLRAKLLFTPSNDLRSLLTIGYTDGKAPQSERVVRPFADRVAQFPNQPTFQSDNTYGIWDLIWNTSELITLELNLSLTDFHTERHATTGLGNLSIDGDETVVQPLVRFNGSSNITGFMGAYLFRSEQDEWIDLFGGGTFRDETDNDAIFAEASYQLSDTLSLTAGARYEDENRLRTGDAGPFLVDFEDNYSEFLPKAVIAWAARDQWTLGLTAGKGYNGGGAGITFSPPFVAYTYDPEFVWNYEGFVRGTAMEGKLSLTANIFYNDFEGLQLPFNLAAGSTVIRNADKATTFGIETSVSYAFSEGNAVYADIGLLQTKVDEYDDQTVEGNDLARSPAFSVNLGLILTPLNNFEVSSNVRYTDTYYSDALNTARGKIDAYAVANAQVAYTLNSLRCFISVENLFDSDHEVSVLVGSTAELDSATLLKPRTVSAGIEYSF